VPCAQLPQSCCQLPRSTAPAAHRRIIQPRRTWTICRQLQQLRRTLQVLFSSTPPASFRLRLPSASAATSHNPHTATANSASGSPSPRTNAPYNVLNSLNSTPHRPPVRNDVVHGDQQHMLLVGQLDQTPADQRPRLPIKTPPQPPLPSLALTHPVAFKCCRKSCSSRWKWPLPPAQSVAAALHPPSRTLCAALRAAPQFDPAHVSAPPIQPATQPHAQTET